MIVNLSICENMMENFCKTLKENELWLMERILSYAKKQGFTKYSSTLVEAWRVSINGLSDAIIQGCAMYGDNLPEFLPDENFEADPITQFGIDEARLHRERGISLSMFLGLYKYYRYAYEDLVKTYDVPGPKKEFYHAFVERCFDRIEIAFCNQWSNLNNDKLILELQESNRLMTNEKNKYLTLFESLELPTFLIDENGLVENINVPASELLGDTKLAGSLYYSTEKQENIRKTPISELLPWLKSSVDYLLGGIQRVYNIEIVAQKETEERTFQASLSRMRDVSGKFRGGVIVLHDVTEQRRMERLKEDVERITRHDLKIPLSGILTTFNCLLDDESILEDQRYLLTMARASGYTMLEMINRSLDLYKMETGTYQFEPKCVDLSSVIGRVIEHSDGLARGRNIKINLDIQSDDSLSSKGPMLLAEEMLLYTALGNIVTNALEAAPPNSTVHISVTMNKACHIKISNKSCVPKQVRDNFF